jgi:hypothetical protein
MQLTFDQAAIGALFARVVSPCKQIGAWKSSVIQHEPKAVPTALPALALWWSDLTPLAGYSGLAETAGRVEFTGRVYVNFRGRPEDEIDPLLMSLASQVIGAFTGAFTLDGDVALIDLLGAYGAPLSARPGYIEHDGQEFRVAQIVIPLIADGLWVQTP